MNTRLLDRQLLAERTMGFRLEKPLDFTFRPGQNIDLTLVDPPQTDAEGNVRTFSLACDPHESTLLVATRLRDTAFKRVFETMPLGTPLTLDGPHGDLLLPQRSNRTVVLLAGGIGITPFLPMVQMAARERLPHRIILFFGNRRPEDAPFLDDLLALQQQNPRYTCVAIMAEMEKSRLSWDGPRGLIDAALLAQHLQDAVEPLYFIAGPPGMVAALRQMLTASGVIEDDIRTEEFAGY